MSKKKKRGRYTPPKRKPDWHKPWWERRIYKGCDKDTYFWRVIDFLEDGPIDESLILPVINNKTRWHF